MYILIGLIIVSVIAYFVLNKKKNNADSENIVKKTEVKKTKNEVNIENLLKTNVLLRTSCKDKDLLLKIESIIDLLREISKTVNLPENYSESTPLVNRMVEKYLPTYLNTFLNLDLKSKEEKKDSFIQGLNTLEKTLLDIDKSIKSNNIDEFSKQINFVNAFFEGDYSGGN